MYNIVPVILCGGSGTRLWPLSRAGFPKQFLALTGKESLFQQSVVRARALAGADIHLDDLLLVMHEDHRFLALDQLNAMESAEAVHFLLEPVARNTAPALTLAALEAQSLGEDPILVVMPADQNVAHRSAGSAPRRHHSLTAIDIPVTYDIVFAQIPSGLYLDNLERDGSRVGKAVDFPLRNIGRLVFMQ